MVGIQTVHCNFSSLGGEFHSLWAQHPRAMGTLLIELLGWPLASEHFQWWFLPVVTSFCFWKNPSRKFLHKNPELCLTFVLQKSQWLHFYNYFPGKTNMVMTSTWNLHLSCDKYLEKSLIFVFIFVLLIAINMVWNNLIPAYTALSTIRINSSADYANSVI